MPKRCCGALTSRPSKKSRVCPIDSESRPLCCWPWRGVRACWYWMNRRPDSIRWPGRRFWGNSWRYLRTRIEPFFFRRTTRSPWRSLRLVLSPEADLPSLPGVVEVGGSKRLPVLVTNHFDPAMVSACNDAGATVQAVDPMTLEEIFVANVHSRREKQTV